MNCTTSHSLKGILFKQAEYMQGLGSIVGLEEYSECSKIFIVT